MINFRRANQKMWRTIGRAISESFFVGIFFINFEKNPHTFKFCLNSNKCLYNQLLICLHWYIIIMTPVLDSIIKVIRIVLMILFLLDQHLSLLIIWTRWSRVLIQIIDYFRYFRLVTWIQRLFIIMGGH